MARADANGNGVSRTPMRDRSSRIDASSHGLNPYSCEKGARSGMSFTADLRRTVSEPRWLASRLSSNCQTLPLGVVNLDRRHGDIARQAIGEPRSAQKIVRERLIALQTLGQDSQITQIAGGRGRGADGRLDRAMQIEAKRS